MGSRRKPIPEKIQGRITKFFVTNLPDKCSGQDVAEFIRPFGVIFDLYIARKRDKIGNRFGFVSMLDVKDIQQMEKNLSGIKMGDYGLKANVARFMLEDGEIGLQQKEYRSTEKGESSKRSMGGGSGIGESRFQQGGKSFQETLTGKRNVAYDTRLVAIEDKIVAFHETHGKAVIFRMLDLETLKNIKVTLRNLNVEEGKVQYLGGLSVMVTYKEKDTAQEVIKAAKEVVGNFSAISSWEGQVLAYERLAWLKIKGLPLQLMKEEGLAKVGEVFGKIVHKPPRSNEDVDLSYEYMGVLVGEVSHHDNGGNTWRDGSKHKVKVIAKHK